MFISYQTTLKLLTAFSLLLNTSASSRSLHWRNSFDLTLPLHETLMLNNVEQWEVLGSWCLAKCEDKPSQVWNPQTFLWGVFTTLYKPQTESGLTFHTAFIFTSITVKNKSKPSSIFIPVGKITLQTQLSLLYSQAIGGIFSFTLEEHTQSVQ